MGLVLSKDRIRDPEAIISDIHSLSSQSDFKTESKNEFRLKIIFMMVFAVVIRIALAEVVPSVVDLILALLAGIILLEFSLSNIVVCNNFIKTKGASAILVIMSVLIVVTIIGGQF